MFVEAGAPGLSDKSGQWHWLKDWRRKKQEQQAYFTDQNLADHLRALRQTKNRLTQIPSHRMNTVITDLMLTLPIQVGRARS